MAWCESFPPQVTQQCKVLILGSMPGVKSLQDAQYYAHPRNAFWPIIESLFSIPKQLPYKKRLQALNAEGVGLWDVYASCYRPGSLDSSIEKNDSQVNDFAALFEDLTQLHTLCFNGKAAEQAFKKSVDPGLYAGYKLISLPSTSPANATLNFDEKLRRWQSVKESVRYAA